MWFFSKKDNNAERIKKVAIFASFSLKSILEPYIEYYLENLKKNFDTVILVTNNRELDKSVFTFLSGMNIELFQVTNEGFDFGMWQKVLFALNPNEIKYLCLANDSCIPVCDFSSFITQAMELKSNYVGLTDNYEIKFHIQSYFLVIKNEGINLAFAYFKKNGIISDFNKVVMTYEIGLSQYMLKKGQRPKALFNATKYNKGGKINITIQFAEELIKDGFPFIKRKLLLKNFRKQEADYLKQLGFDLQQDYIQVVKKYHPSFEFHFD